MEAKCGDPGRPQGFIDDIPSSDLRNELLRTDVNAPSRPGSVGVRGVGPQGDVTSSRIGALREFSSSVGARLVVASSWLACRDAVPCFAAHAGERC